MNSWTGGTRAVWERYDMVTNNGLLWMQWRWWSGMFEMRRRWRSNWPGMLRRLRSCTFPCMWSLMAYGSPMLRSHLSSMTGVYRSNIGHTMQMRLLSYRSSVLERWLLHGSVVAGRRPHNTVLRMWLRHMSW